MPGHPPSKRASAFYVLRRNVENEHILSTIGNTPLIGLNRVFQNAPFRLFAKLEGFNPGGSIKDRAALCIIKDAFAEGKLRPSTTIIESSSGNMGIGLAQICRYLGLRFICVIDPKTTAQNVSILEAYGAEIDYVSKPDPVTGEFLQARINRVKELLNSTADSFWPDQYSNLSNAKAHRQTMREVAEALHGNVDYLFCATSTCGTLRGCAEYVRENNLDKEICCQCRRQCDLWRQVRQAPHPWRWRCCTAQTFPTDVGRRVT